MIIDLNMMLVMMMMMMMMITTIEYFIFYLTTHTIHYTIAVMKKGRKCFS